MTANPMVDEVNRLVGNLLAGGGDVFLPGVGSLFCERRPARQLNKRTLMPPCRVVSFSSQQRGISLVDEIARVTGCDAAAAQDVYDRWLSRVREEETLTLEGIGVLKFKNFTLSEAFDRRLNPQGHAPVRIAVKRGFDWVIWMGVAAILVAVGVVGVIYVPDMLQQRESIVVAEAVVEPAPEPIPAAVPDSVADVKSPVGDSLASAAEIAPEKPTVVATAAAGTPESPAAFTPGHRYVVLGVFSTAPNATRAIADAVAKEPSLRCGVYRFGEKLLVSPFDAADADACTDFIRARSDLFPGMWTYTAR